MTPSDKGAKMRMTILIGALLVLVLGGCGAIPHERPWDVGCKYQISTLVMREVHVGNWNDVNVYSANKADLDAERAEIKRVFSWSKTIPDKDVRDCYEQWLWYYDYELDSAYAQLEVNQKTARWRESHVVPTVPREP